MPDARASAQAAAGAAAAKPRILSSHTGAQMIQPPDPSLFHLLWPKWLTARAAVGFFPANSRVLDPRIGGLPPFRTG